MRCTAIIPAAGIGTRFGGSLPKQFSEYESIPILIHTLKLFERIPEVNSVILAITPSWEEYTREMITVHGLEKVQKIIPGGKERQDSVFNSLNIIEPNEFDVIIIHDAVRPFVSSELVRKIINTAGETGAVIPALKPKETIKQFDDKGFIIKTLDRTVLCAVQTPQGFKSDVIISSYKKAMKENFYATDDAALVEYSGFPVKVIDGEETNIKITTQFDIHF
ncbi:MAG: 2-C-methyl-D-erythritol 4-phosphate cytidylyltransferase [Ignavibacteriae bacterium]|nr:2-C-methyl-D-erythritol 4-phosphate cytidylyltransferase [Ignavibacteriota bacterium]